ncbi:hypothetical protein [Pseudoxanthobacter sp.]|uniref:hypothetical protein n=1 Tax=Pseudoxanthobacter sp. TaxID=1925742 RepID=UPI002FE39D12
MPSGEFDSDALVGHTGFVGGNLMASHDFGAVFNSRTIGDIGGRSFRTLVCAAAPATMWAANKDPEADLANIRRLIAGLETAKADRFVLISTVAVLADAAAGADETTALFETGKAYGRNRRLLEEACAALFPATHILRLPALFGQGMKKNFLFDILNPVPSFLTRERYAALEQSLPAPAAALLPAVYRFADGVGMYEADRSRLAGETRAVLTAALSAAGATALAFTNPGSTFQYYGLAGLWDDIGRAIAHDLPVLHLAPEPLMAGDICRALTGSDQPATAAPLYHEDMRTAYSQIWDGPPGYIRSKAAVMADLKAFCEKARRP